MSKPGQDSPSGPFVSGPHLPQVAPPPPRSVLVTSAIIQVPLASLGVLDEAASEVYRVFGLQTDQILIEDASYTALAAQIAQARNAIRQSRESGCPLSSYTIRVAAKQVRIPCYQPQISPVLARAYALLGIETVDLVVGAHAFTVLSSYLTSAKSAIDTLTSHWLEGPRPPSGPDGPAPCPVGRSVPVNTRGLTIQDYYTEYPSQTVLTLSAMFGTRFLCLQDRGGRTFYVPSLPEGVGGVAQRLGLYL